MACDDVKFLSELVRLQPLTSRPDSIRQVAELLRKRLESNGLHCVVEEYAGRPLLYASTRPGRTPEYLFNAHLDVVPADDPRQFEPVERGGFLYGRGVSDCLGNVLWIVKALELARDKADAGAIFTSDEETGGETTRESIRRGYLGRRMILIGDGDNRRLIVGQKGVAKLRLVAHGRSAHAADVWCGDNAVDKLLDGYRRIRDWWGKPSEENDQWISTMTATIISGGTVDNRIPDRAELLLDLRLVGPESAEEIVEQFRNRSGLEVELLRSALPVETPVDHPEFRRLWKCFDTFYGAPVKIGRINGATDAWHYVGQGIPIAIVGIGQPGAHSAEEKVEIASIDEAARLFASFISGENR